MPSVDTIFRGNATSTERAASSAAASVTKVGKAGKAAGHELQTATGHADAFGHSIKHIAALTIGTLGLHELVHGLREAVNAAGDVEKQQHKVVRVFGETPKVLEQFEKSSAKAYGISHLAALKAASSTGALLTNLGVGPKYAAGLAVGIQKLSADVASFNDLPTAVVADRVNKALLGQTRGLKSLGISLSQTDVNAKALAIGLVKPVKSADGLRAATDKVTVAERKYGEAVRDHGKDSKESLTAEAGLIAANKAREKAVAGVTPKLTAQQQALATLALIYERSKKQQGDFQRNADSLANSSKALDAEFANLSDRVGDALEPAIKQLVEFMAGPGIAGAGNFLTTVETDSRKVYNAVQPLAPVAHAAAQGFLAIARTDGVIPTILGIAAAYKGTTGVLRAGQSAYLSAAGAISNLANPFRTVSAAAEATGSVMVGAGFTGKVVKASSLAEKAAPSFLNLANPIGAIATVAALAVGGLVLLATTTESAGDKARKARDDFLGLVDAVNKVKSTRLDVKQSALDVSKDQAAIAKFSPTLVAARAGVHQSFPDTPQGDRQAAAAKQTLNDALHTQDQNYINLARDRQRHADAVAAETKAEADQKKQAKQAADAIDGLSKKLISAAALDLPKGLRGGHSQADIRQTSIAIADINKQFADVVNTSKGITPVQHAALTAIKTFVTGTLKETGKIPPAKTLKILLEDAASGKLNELRAKLQLLQNKTITVTTVTSNPIAGGGRGKAAGGIIDRPQTVLVGEEAPSHPEFVIPTNPARRGRALGLISQMRSWIPGFADGAGPPETLAQQEARARANTPAKASKKTAGTTSTRSKKADTDHRPAWLKHWQDDLGSKLPGDDAFTNAVARAQADLDDAGRTTAKSDDIKALHALIRISTKRLPALHSMRGAHKEAVWQTAVNSEISTVDGQLAGYRSSLTDAVKRPGPDDITVSVPSAIAWGIEKAGFSDSPSDDISAQTKKKRWLLAQLNAKDKKGHYKLPLNSAKRIAFTRELARTNAELTSLGKTQSDDKQSAADQAAQDAATPPDLPIGVQQALADAALTPGTADDWMALKLEQSTLQQQLGAATNPTVQVALKQALAGVNDEISSLEAGDSSSAADSGPTPDQEAQLTQAQSQRDVALRGLALAGAEIKGFGSSGDIGTSVFGNAFDAARGGPTLAILGDSRSLAAIGNAAVQGMGAQPSVNSNRVFVGV